LIKEDNEKVILLFSHSAITKYLFGERKITEDENIKSEAPHCVSVLFQGDSITHAGRYHIRNGAGNANCFSAKVAEKRLRFMNLGVAGDKIRDLKNRWREDCLDLEPNVVSILVGINDVVGVPFRKSLTSTKSFEQDYRTVLEQTHDILGAKIVLLTPFMVYLTKQQLIYKIILKPKIDVVKKLSNEFETILVPLDRIFEEATRKKDPAHFSADGVHPTANGHSLIAQSWIKATNGILT
jgi:acyl-CoA thioesterase-1